MVEEVPLRSIRGDGGEPAAANVELDPSDRMLKERLYERLFPSIPAPTARLGRFVLLRELGRGGMGVVLSAYDEQLDRKVAIKLLHGEALHDAAARARLLREAQALARLSHPNVVQVHEAGMHEEQVYVVMEHVEGMNLRQWLAEHAPKSVRAGWRVVLSRMLAAGEGLAAAHEAGLTHRDFKPDNVLVGADGRVRVADFGLATEVGPSEGGETVATETLTTESTNTEESKRTTTDGTSPRPLERVTRTGFVVGTAAYMPLEQMRGEGVDAKSDQFSFCVTLYEALFGRRPFEGVSRAAIELALEAGEPEEPVQAIAVPRWLRKAMWRGLRREPEERFDDMRGLLRALERPRRQRWLGAAGAVVLVASGIGIGVSRAPDSVTPEPCTDTGRAIDEAWNDGARHRLQDVLEPTPAGFVVGAVDDWSDRWRETAAQACEQVYVEQLASEESLDVRGRCLDERRYRLGSVLRVLEAHDELGGPAVVEALARLERPEDCLLDRGDPLAGLSDAQLTMHRRLSDRLVELDIVQSGRSVSQRRSRARELYEQAGREGLAEVQRQAAYLQGRLALLASDREGAERWLGEAIDRAEQLGLDDERALAWLQLIGSALFLEVDPARAEWIWARVQPLVEEGSGPSRVHAISLLARGRILLVRGELDAAASQVDAGLALLEQLGPTARFHLYIGVRLRILVATRRGDGELALQLSKRARQILSTDEPSARANLGTQRYDDGVALYRRGDLDGARRVLQEAIGKIELEQPDSTALGQAHVAMSAVLDGLGEPLVAQAHAERADVIIREDAGFEDPRRVGALSARGLAAFRQERFESAAESFALALEITDRQPQPDPIELADHEVNLAEARYALGQHREAERLLEKAIATFEARLGLDHVDLALPYEVRGAVRLALGRAEAAEVDLRRASILHERSGQSPVEAAETGWLLAQALDALDRRADAVERAELVIRSFDALGPSWEGRAEEVRRWRASRVGPVTDSERSSP